MGLVMLAPSLRLSLWIGGLAVAAALVACSSNDDEDASSSAAHGAVSRGAFDANDVLDDTSLRDSEAMTEDDVQHFLEETPWGNASVLATYEEGGMTAAQIMTAAAKKHGINPLEMIVRVQMEQGLVKKTTASDKAINYAFGCGCPSAPVCKTSPEKYTGFANQAECAAGTLARSMERAVTTKGTVSGWARNRAKSSEDGVMVTPANAATAALYTYTPWVGEAGGGRAGVGGVSLHARVWETFADHVGYGAAGNGPAPLPTTTADPPAPPPPDDTGEDAGADDTADAGGGASSFPVGDGGARPPEDGSDDDDILQGGNSPPANNDAPPPKSAPTKGYTPGSEETASEDELAPKKKTSGGCAQSGAHAPGSNAGVVGLAVAAALLASRRRRR